MQKPNIPKPIKPPLPPMPPISRQLSAAPDQRIFSAPNIRTSPLGLSTRAASQKRSLIGG